VGAEHTILFTSGLLLLAIVVQPLARKIHLPFTVTLVIAGFVASELLVMAGIDTGVRADSFHDLIFFVFLPVLVFESAYNTNAQLLWRNLFPILFLAIPLMLLSTLITAVLVYYAIGHPAGFPWIAALLTGALLSATDPVAVVALLRQMGVSERLAILMEGESLFNDATAIVIFSVFLAMATGMDNPVSVPDATLHFLRVFFGGILVGVGTGLLFTGLVRLLDEAVIRAVSTVISAYLAFIIAESLLHVSGVMAVLVTGLILGKTIRSAAKDTDSGFVQELWKFNSYVANALVFLLMGVTITLGMFEERWLAMLIGIAGILIARAAGIFTCVPLLNKTTPIEPIGRPYQVILFWGGLRGAVTLALALSLPTTLDYWWTIQSIAFGVVLFTLFVQATSTAPVLRHYGLTRK
jgi:CPA1 family monovalent cation:H+ antiporter